MTTDKEPRKRSPRLSRLEQLLCRRVGVDPEDVLGVEPKALIVGESPGAHYQPDAPMFPYQQNSPGGRLQIMSGMKHLEYLQNFQRVNLIDAHPGKVWPDHHAAIRAEALTRAMSITRWPMVLCGQKVMNAFCLTDATFGHWYYLDRLERFGDQVSQMYWSSTPSALQRIAGAKAICIPWPGGLRSKADRALTMQVLRDALSPPLETHTVPVCGPPLHSEG